MEVSNYLVPANVLLLKEEIKVCQGCVVEEGIWEKKRLNKFANYVKDQYQLPEGVLSASVDPTLHQSVKGKTFAKVFVILRHKDNHFKCYNYVINTMSKIVYEYINK